MRVLALFVILAASASAAVPFKSTRPLTGMRASAFRPQSNCFTQCPQLCPNKITAANAAVCTDINDWYSTTISSLQQTAKLPASCASLASQLLCPVLYGASDYYNNVINCDAEKSKDVPARLCQSACQDAVQQLTQCAQAAGGSDFKPTFLSVLLSCDAVSVHSSDCMSAQGLYVPPADDSNDDSMSSSSTTGIVLGVALCLFLIAAAVVICYNRYKGRPFWHREGSAALQLRERQHAETAEPEVIGGGTYMNGHSGTAIVLNDDDAFRERPPLPPGPPPEHVVERTLAREREDASLLNS